MPSLNRRASCLVILCILLTACFGHGSPETSWSASDKGIYCGAISRDGRYVLLGTEDQGGGLWNTDVGDRIYRWNHGSDRPANFVACSFSADGRHALTAGASTLVLWQVESGESLRFYDTPAVIDRALLSADANYALLALADRSVVFFDIRRGGVLQSFPHSSQILTMALSPGNDMAIVALDDGAVRFYNLVNGHSVDTLGLSGRIKTAQFSNSGVLLFVSGSNVEPAIWNLKTGEKLASIGQERRILPGYFSYLTARFSADDSRLITGNASGQAQLWDATSGDIERQWLMPKSSFWLPKSFAIVDVAIEDSSQEYVALTSGGSIHLLQ